MIRDYTSSKGGTHRKPKLRKTCKKLKKCVSTLPRIYPELTVLHQSKVDRIFLSFLSPVPNQPHQTSLGYKVGKGRNNNADGRKDIDKGLRVGENKGRT